MASSSTRGQPVTRTRTRAALPAVLAELEQAGGPVAHVEADFTDPAAPAAVIRAAQDALGHVDILVVNHSLERRGALAELTADDLDAQLQVNVRAPLLLVKEFAGQHDGRAGGRVVLFTSGQHRAPMRSEVAYAAAKGALHQVTLTLSDELIERGITVNTICPGPTDTGWIPEDWDPRARNPAGPLGPARRCRTADRLALLRRRGVDHRPGHRLRGRLPPLGG